MNRLYESVRFDWLTAGVLVVSGAAFACSSGAPPSPSTATGSSSGAIPVEQSGSSGSNANGSSGSVMAAMNSSSSGSGGSTSSSGSTGGGGPAGPFASDASTGSSGANGSSSGGSGGGMGQPALDAGVGGPADAAGTTSVGPIRKVQDAGSVCGATATWANRTMQGVADPSMSKQGNTYYVFGTGGGFASSTDLVTFSRGGSIFPSGLPAWTNQYIASPSLWAPDVHLVNGKYYAYYAISAWNNFNSSIGLATNTTLDGSTPWADEGDVVDYKTGGAGVNVIDPDLFVDDDGSWWLIYGSYKAGLRLIPLDPATGKSLTSPPVVTEITPSLGEGSDIIKHNGYYYVFASRGKCCAGLQSTYQIVMGRAKDVHGPYLGMNGEQLLKSQYTVFLTGDAQHPGVGGQSFFRDTDGQLLMVYMAYTAPSGASILNVRPMWFDSNDWPTLDPCLASTY